jgi:His-Xaa-Ser system radical SAM maturase HxsC
VIPLHGRAQSVDLAKPLQRRVWLLVDPDTTTGQRGHRAYLSTNGDPAPEGFALYLAQADHPAPVEGRSIVLPATLGHLGAGDVVSISPDGGRIRVLWRERGRVNSVLLTERCDNYCLMCSQPPKTQNDDWLLEDARELIRLLPRHTREIGFTGGEPTFYGEGLTDLLTLCTSLLPQTQLHVLSNGRRFSDLAYAAAWAAIDNPNLMVGIPVYGAETSLHDYVVQAHGAFNETIRGIINLARLNQRIEIRVVLHQQTAPALVEIAEFITRNLPFVDQVALMGLETTGFARANLDQIWIDPTEYAPALTEAAYHLDQAGIKTMIYNHQLCLIEPAAWPFTVKSISDWKNEYHPECQHCAVADRCGGFFHSAKYKISDNIHAIPASPIDTDWLESPTAWVPI